jgi:hypothetical protein
MHVSLDILQQTFSKSLAQDLGKFTNLLRIASIKKVKFTWYLHTHTLRGISEDSNMFGS